MKTTEPTYPKLKKISIFITHKSRLKEAFFYMDETAPRKGDCIVYKQTLFTVVEVQLLIDEEAGMEVRNVRVLVI